jgi:diguanylate cyclase (GGDEF)-like protein
VTARKRLENGAEPKSLRDLAWIPLGIGAFVLCLLTLAVAVGASRNGPWLYLAILLPCLAFGATFWTGFAISRARKTAEQKKFDPNHTEWVRALLNSLEGVWLVREPGGDLVGAIALAVESLATGIGLGETWAFLTDKSDDGLRLIAHYSVSPKGSQMKLPHLAMSMAQCALQVRRPVEADAFPHLRRLPDLTHTEARSVSAIALPLRSGERVWGALFVASEPGCSLSRDQKEVVKTFSEMLAVTLEATLLYDEVRRTRDQVNALFNIAMDITSHLRLEDLLEALVRRSVTLLDGFCGGVRLIEHTESGWQYGHTTTWRVDEDDREALPGLERQAESVVEDGRPVVVETPVETARASYGSEGVGKTIGAIVPLKWEGEVIGVLYVLMDERVSPFDEADTALLSLLASQAAIAVQNSRLYENCHTLAVTDPLTGLYNRRLFSEQLSKEISRSGREGTSLSIIVLDVDGLKEYNDSRGHHEGDRVLCEIAGTLELATRESDIACRYGGDEFAALLPQAIHAEALRVAERIRSEVESRRRPGPGISVSIGLATYPADARDGESLMLVADRRVYVAKGLGGNRVCGSKADFPRETVVG